MNSNFKLLLSSFGAASCSPLASSTDVQCKQTTKYTTLKLHLFVVVFAYNHYYKKNSLFFSGSVTPEMCRTTGGLLLTHSPSIQSAFSISTFYYFLLFCCSQAHKLLSLTVFSYYYLLCSVPYKLHSVQLKGYIYQYCLHQHTKVSLEHLRSLTVSTFCLNALLPWAPSFSNFRPILSSISDFKCILWGQSLVPAATAS